MFSKMLKSKYLHRSSASGIFESFSCVSRRFFMNVKEPILEIERKNAPLPDFKDQLIRFKLEVVLREIEKRDASYIGTASNLKGMIAKLRSLIETSPSIPDNLLSLTTLYYYDFSSIPLENLLKVLELYTNPFDVSQSNIYYLVNYKGFMDEFWQIIMNNSDSLTFQQIFTVFQSMQSIHTIYSKKFSPKENLPSNEIIENLLGKSLKLVQNVEFDQISSLIVAAKSLNTKIISQNIHLLQLEMAKKVRNVEKMDLETLKNVAINLPRGFYNENKELVKEIEQRVWENVNNLWIGDLVWALIGINRSGLKLDFEFGLYFSSLTEDYLEDLHFHNITEIVEFLCENNLLSVFIAQEIFKAIPKYLKNFNVDVNSVIKLLYEMDKASHIYISINSNLIFNLCEKLESSSQENQLKYSIMVLPTDTKNSFASKISKALIGKLDPSSEETQNNLPLIIKLQDLLIESLKESPIYNYQLLSYETMPSNLRLNIVKYLHSTLKQMCPNHPLVFKYLSEIDDSEPVNIEDFEIKLDLDNFPWVSKCLWKNKIKPQAYKNVIKFIEELKQTDVDLTESLYYLISSTKLKIPVYLNLIKTNSPFYLPLSFETGIVHADKEEIQEGIKGCCLLGEPLVKCLIVCVENGIFLDSIKKLSQNLTFSYTNQKPVDLELAKRLIFGIIKSKIPVDNQAFFRFTKKFYRKFELSEKNFALKASTETFPEFLKFSESEKEKPTDEAIKFIEKLEKSKKNSVHDKKSFDSVLNMLSTESDKSKLLNIVSSLLDYLSIVGDIENKFKDIYDCIEKNELLNEFSVQDLENYFFILWFGNSQLPVPLGQADRLKDLFGLCIEDENNDELYLNESQNLKYYKSFKYNTEYENRFLVNSVKNDLSHIHSLLNDDEVTLDEMYRKIKQAQLLKNLNLPVPENYYLLINKYFYTLRKNKTISLAKSKANDLAIKKLNLKISSVDHKSQHLELWNLFDLLLTYENNNAGILLLNTNLFIKEESTSHFHGISHPLKSLINKMSELTGLQIFPYESKSIIDSKNPETHSFMAMLKKHKKKT